LQFFKTFRAVLGPTHLLNGYWWLFLGHALACRTHRTVDRVFFKHKDLQNMTVNSPIGLMANTRLCVLP